MNEDWTEDVFGLRFTAVSPNTCGGGISSGRETQLDRSSCYDSLAGRQNMRGLVASMDLEMELAETDEVVVSPKLFVLLTRSALFMEADCIKPRC